ncbi:MAG: ROK family protein, partial [Sandaracinaceae bacterium]|nr:ROK family protein [Sandaracinaceae bacterium]
LLRNSNTTALNSTPLRQMLEEAIGRPIRIENDANCFALSEAIDGAAKNARVVFGVIVGTGTGGGIVVDRRIWPGPNRIAGEWGHNPLPWPCPEELPGPPCYCGKRGCIETWLSGPALARDHAEFLSAQGHGPPRAPSPPEIAAQAQAGDPLAKATLERYAKRMARALASVINILDPDVIVLGGGLSQIPSLYPLVQKELPKWVFSDHVDVALLPPLHGDASGVRGAAWLSSDENDHLSLAPPLRLDDQSASGQGGF